MPSPFGLPYISPSGLPIKAQAGQEVRAAWNVLDRKIDALLSKIRPTRGHAMYIDDDKNTVESCWDRVNEVGAFPTARDDTDDSQDVEIPPSDDTNEILVTDEEDPE